MAEGYVMVRFGMLKSLQRLVGEEHVWEEVPMRDHTTFRVGGNARYLVEPQDEEQLKKTIELCRMEDMPCYIVGNGSNLLVSDEGYDGVIIHLFKNMSDIQTEGTRLRLQAGALLVRAANLACRTGLTGLEFASGIPGTAGGAVMMNAGAYGGEMKDVVSSVKVLTEDGQFRRYTGDEMQFGYRKSRIAEEQSIVLEVILQLEEGDPEQIQEKMDRLKAQRISKQPLEYASAGSTFKRPEGFFAGKLIQDAGLCGYRIGDAQVSEKHCGFVINRGNATAMEIAELIREVQRKVSEKFGVRLETEVKFLGWK